MCEKPSILWTAPLLGIAVSLVMMLTAAWMALFDHTPSIRGLTAMLATLGVLLLVFALMANMFLSFVYGVV